MNLEKFRKLVGSAKGVLAYFALDKNGRPLTQHKGPLSESIKANELSTWVLNYFHAIDTYYPEAEASLLRFNAMVLYLRREGSTQYAVLLNHEANLSEFEQQFRAICEKGTLSPVKVAEQVAPAPVPSRKGETMLLRISDSGSTSAPTPMVTGAVPLRSATGGLAVPAKEPSKSPVALIVGVAAALVLLVVILAVVVRPGAGSNETARPPVSTGEAVTEARPAEVPKDWEAAAREARQQALAIASLAQERRQAAGADALVDAVALQRSAESAMSAADWEVAAGRWIGARDLFGRALVASEQAAFQISLEEVSLAALFRRHPESIPVLRDARLASTRAADQGDFAAAASALALSGAQLRAVREETLARLAGLAKEAVDQGDGPTALAVYRRVLLADPSDASARDYLFRNGFTPGQTVSDLEGLVLAYIPPGTFTMGATTDLDSFAKPDETPFTARLTDGYFIGVHEVTQAQWQAVMQRPITMPREEPGFIGPNLPAHSVTWQDAVDFCQRLSVLTGRVYRLPTEVEWERAARATSSTPFATGVGTLSFREANIFNPTRDTAVPRPVGTSGAPNAWGLFDVHGNVTEWTASWYGPYPTGEVVNPQGLSEAEVGPVYLATKVMRGGSFFDDFEQARLTSRLRENPVIANRAIGFRVLREIHNFD